MQQSVIRIVNCWISVRFPQVRNSSRVRLHQHASSFTIFSQVHVILVVAEQESVYGMSGTEGQDLGGTDAIDLQLSMGATVSSRMPTTAVDTSIDSTSNTFDRHEEFVPSDAISWRQGKFSWLEMVLLDCSAQSANHLMKDSRKLKTT